jgi:pilus assembly protein CpaD
VTANVAAQIDNPADLLSPRDLDPPDAVRRQNELDIYRVGAVTSTTKDQQASGAISSVVP